jgi:hypothetical protein
MHLPINVKSPNNIRKYQMGFNSAFKRLSVPYAFSRSVDISKLPVWGEYACPRDYLLRLEYLWEISSNMRHHSCFISSFDGRVLSASPFPDLTSGKEPAIPVIYSSSYVYFAVRVVYNT